MKKNMGSLVHMRIRICITYYIHSSSKDNELHKIRDKFKLYMENERENKHVKNYSEPLVNVSFWKVRLWLVNSLHFYCLFSVHINKLSSRQFNDDDNHIFFPHIFIVCSSVYLDFDVHYDRCDETQYGSNLFQIDNLKQEFTRNAKKGKYEYNTSVMLDATLCCCRDNYIQSNKYWLRVMSKVVCNFACFS